MAEQSEKSPLIPGAELFAHHLLHDDEYRDENTECRVPVSPSDDATGTSKLHHSFPCLDSSPRCHAKDNLEISFQSLKKENFSADVFAKHLMHDEEYPKVDLEPDPDHRYHLKDKYVPKDVPVLPKKHQTSRRHSEPRKIVPLPKSNDHRSPSTTRQEKISVVKSGKYRHRHSKDAYVPIDGPLPGPHSRQHLGESILTEPPELEFVSLSTAPEQEPASAEVFAAHLLHEEEYPPEVQSEHRHHLQEDEYASASATKGVERKLSRQNARNSSSLDPADPRPETPPPASAYTFAKHLLHDNEYPQISPLSENRHHLKDQYIPEVVPLGAAREHSRRHTSAPVSTKSITVAPLPDLPEARKDDSSTRSMANSQDCASLGSLSYAGNLKHAPQEGKKREPKEAKHDSPKTKKKGSRGHARRHSETVQPIQFFKFSLLLDLSLQQKDNASTQSMADSQDCASLGSLSYDGGRKAERHDEDSPKEEKKNKRHVRRHSDPVPPKSGMVVSHLPDLSLRQKQTDSASTQSMADSQDCASLGSLSYVGHSKTFPVVLDDQKEEQPTKQQHDSSPKKQSTTKGKMFHFRRHSEPVSSKKFVFVDPLPQDLFGDWRDDVSCRSMANSQDCASLGSLSYVGHLKQPPLSVENEQEAMLPKGSSLSYAGHLKHPPLLEEQEQEQVQEKQRSPTNNNKGRRRRSAFPFEHKFDAFLSKMNHLVHLENP